MPGHGRAHTVAAGFASVVGAGLIGLPAAVLHTTGSAAVLTWLIAVVVCIPMIVLLRDTVVGTPGSEDPLRATITAGLGKGLGDLVPIVFGLVVMVGLPTNASISAHNLAAVTGISAPILTIASIGLAVVVNLVGGRLGAKVQQIGMVVLVIVLIGVTVWAGAHPVLQPQIAPESVAAVPAGVLLAFWAFVGFENLTFLARDMRDPKRDFVPVAMVILLLLASLAIALTLAIGSQLTQAAVDPVTGLVDAASVTPGGQAVAAIVATAGALGVFINAVVWIRGVGLILGAASRAHLLPVRLDSRDAVVPRRAIGVLSLGAVGPTVVLLIWPDLVVPLLAAASSVFVVIYLVTIAAYWRVGRSWPWRIANAALIPILVWTLWGSGWWAAYGVVVFALAAVLRRMGRPASGQPG